MKSHVSTAHLSILLVFVFCVQIPLLLPVAFWLSDLAGPLHDPLGQTPIHKQYALFKERYAQPGYLPDYTGKSILFPTYLGYYLNV